MKYSYSYIEEQTENILIENNFFIKGFNVNNLVKSLGVQLVEKELNDDVSGLFIMSGDNAIISYNKNEIKERQRFTIAHELGHFFLHSKQKPIFVDKKPKVMFRNSASSSGELHQEREANAFAASLLMPKRLIQEEISSLASNDFDIIKTLAKNFKVSEQAMSFRLSNLGYEIGLY